MSDGDYTGYEGRKKKKYRNKYKRGGHFRDIKLDKLGKKDKKT